MARRPVSLTPTPFDLEWRTEFVERFMDNPDTKRIYPLSFKRRMAAERAWKKAKAESLVSVTTSREEFLLS